MRKLDVIMGDCRDEKKLNRFFPFEPKDHLIPRKKNKTKNTSFTIDMRRSWLYAVKLSEENGNIFVDFDPNFWRSSIFFKLL